MTDRKNPGVAFWATVMVAAALAYPLSFGPACWLVTHSYLPVKPTWWAFRPMTLLAVNGPEPIQKPIWWWAGCFEPSNPETNPNNEAPWLIDLEYRDKMPGGAFPEDE
jgi:hypothetical protein